MNRLGIAGARGPLQTINPGTDAGMASQPLTGASGIPRAHGRETGAGGHGDMHGRRTAAASPPTLSWATEALQHFRETGCRATRERLIVHFMKGHVRSIAERLAGGLPPCVDADDLAQSAFEGLSDCLDRFDPTRGIRFESYSRRRISGAMHDYLRREDTISRLARSRSKLMRAGVQAFEAVHGRPPPSGELRRRLGMDEHGFNAAMRDMALPGTVAFNAGEGSAGDGDAMSSIQDERPSARSNPDREDLRTWLCRNLDARDSLIVVLYYYDELTMREVGQAVGCSESRVSQRLVIINQCLRARLADRPDIVRLMAG